ncbi:MAG: hypothetical protein JWN48_6153 [Myxococcaceae bacterium]|nr:hypothetical protein [Myxococcaceae bacterium]
MMPNTSARRSRTIASAQRASVGLWLALSTLLGCTSLVDGKLEDKPTEDELRGLRAAEAGAGQGAPDGAASLGDASGASRPGSADAGASAVGSMPAASNGATDDAGSAATGAAGMQLCVGVLHACGLLPSGEVTCWGDSDTDDGQRTLPLKYPHPATRFRDISCGDYHTCGVTTAGDLHCVGRNRAGQALFDASSGDWEQVAAGDEQTCARKRDGTVQCWGKTYAGSTPPSYAFSSISAGGGFACGIRKDDGVVLCWGNPDGGRTLAPTSGGMKSLDVGSAQGCALDASDRLHCWGVGSASTPVLTARAVSVGGTAPGLSASSMGSRACALLFDGSVKCWIDGDAPVSPGRSVAVLAVGASSSCFVPADGSNLFCDSEEQDGIQTLAPTPYPPPGHP